MGQLTALQNPTQSVKTPGGDLVVRGLSFEDLWIVAVEHGPEAAMLFGKVVNKEKVNDTDVKLILTGLLPEAPGMVASIIALAADEYTPEGVAAAKKLTPKAQLNLLEAIFVLTIQSESELKNFVEDIIRMLSGATGLMQQVSLPLSEAGFGEYAKA